MRDKVHKYLEYIWKENSNGLLNKEEQKIISKLSPNLRNSLMLKSYEHILKNI